jgi:hypothetical protein
MKKDAGSTKVILVVLAAFFGAIIFAGLGIYGYINGIRTEGIDYETRLNAQYLDNQNILSEFISGFYEQLGLANLKSEKMDKIITDAVVGRYGEKGFSSGGAFIAAIKEAYPDTAGLNIYDKIVDYVKAKREGYRATQSKLLDMLRAYDKWRNDGIVQSWIVKNFLGIPSDRLEARIGTKISRGTEARDQMYLIVLAEQATTAYETGKMAPLTVK